MTQQELEFIKNMLKLKQQAAQELWIEVQLLRSLLIDTGWMSEQAVDQALQRGKADPENVRLSELQHAAEEPMRAQIGLADWLADFDRKFPHTD